VVRRELLYKLLLLLLVLGSFVLVYPVQGKVIQDLEYAEVDGQTLLLDLYLPDGVANPSLVVWVHGGGWKSGNKKNCSIKWLTEHGYAVASISYRFSSKAPFPAQIHDVKGAIRWLRANAEAYGYLAREIAVAGSSAGGMLASLLGTSGDVEDLEGEVGCNLDQSSRVQAVIDFYGPADFLMRAEHQPDKCNVPGSLVYDLLGGAVNDKIELAKLASPVIHVSKGDPPMLIFHGEKDQQVRPQQSERLRDACQAVGVPVELVMVPDAGHGGKGFNSPDIKTRILDFLKQYLPSTK
jgi:acetyl esterase/lipase